MQPSNVSLVGGDCKEHLRTFNDASFDSIVTDPPYEIGFIKSRWDRSGIAYDVDMWKECLRVLKPGAHLLAFGSPRTYHRMASAIEDAGFEIRDSIHWLYGEGFPHGLDLSKAIDRELGAKRRVVGISRRSVKEGVTTFQDSFREVFERTEPATAEARKWNGWSTALKPAHEPIVVARKPLDGNTAENVIRHGAGGLNTDACRIAARDHSYTRNCSGDRGHAGPRRQPSKYASGGGGIASRHGRWPANVILDEYAATQLDAQGGRCKSGHRRLRPRANRRGYTGSTSALPSPISYGDEGGASRFFYVAKASARERSAGLDRPNSHATVKPLTLMRHLVRLVTPPGGVVLDLFTGSGTTGIAAILEGMRFVGIEKESEYLAIAQARIAHWEEERDDQRAA